MKISDSITGYLKQVISNLGLGEVNSINLEHPTEVSHGDYSTNLAMQLFGGNKNDQEFTQKFSNPRALAQAIVEQLQTLTSSDKNIEKIEVAGPGFINFTLSDEFFLEKLGESNTISQTHQDKKIVVEYSSPNIAKPFTIGHLRSTIIGDAVANLLEAVGATVYRDNHLGDWGTQFGKQIYAIKTWGDETQIENSERPVKELVNLYVKFHQEAEINPEIEEEGRAWFKKLEDGDSEARRLWQKCIDWSWKEFNQIYEKLGITFTENGGRGYGESAFEDKMAPVIEELKEKKLLTESEKAQLVFFPNDEFSPLMILKGDGASLYATRDLATDKFRLEKYGDDVLIINETGLEQRYYFHQVFKVEEMLGWLKPEQRCHIGHGLYRFKDKKMSTRKGNVLWLEDVLQEAFDRVKKQAENRIDDESIWKVAIGALKWSDLRRDAKGDIVFDWDETLALQGNSGPYLQYTYVRCHSILQKAGEDVSANVSNKLQLSSEEKLVLRWLNQFSEVVEKSAQEYAPHHLAQYLFELAQAFSTFYSQCQILQEKDQEVRKTRLAITKATAQILKEGLGILGIEVVEKM